MDTGGFVLFDGSVVPGVGSCEVEGGGGRRGCLSQLRMPCCHSPDTQT